MWSQIKVLPVEMTKNAISKEKSSIFTQINASSISLCNSAFNGKLSQLYSNTLFSTVLRQMGHSWTRSPHNWHVPCPQRKIIFFRRSMQTGHIVWSRISWKENIIVINLLAEKKCSSWKGAIQDKLEGVNNAEGNRQELD